MEGSDVGPVLSTSSEIWSLKTWGEILEL